MYQYKAKTPIQKSKSILPLEACYVVQQRQGMDVMGGKTLQRMFDPNVIRKRTLQSGCVQAKLSDDVTWENLYEGINDSEVFDSDLGRDIATSQELANYLNDKDEKYYERTLEDDNGGLRRLAEDIKSVRKCIKENEKNPTKYSGFSGGNKDTLSKAQNFINLKIKDTENRKYQGTSNYILEETDEGFNKMKDKAHDLLSSVTRKDDAYLKRYFNPMNETIRNPRAFYNEIRNNFNKIDTKLMYLKYKNNYSRKAGVSGYSYPNETMQSITMNIDDMDIKGTFAKSKPHTDTGGNKRETGLQIRLSNAYRRAKETGRDSKPGVIIHEASHIILGTKDHKYGSLIFELSRNLAKENADTYEYAAEDTTRFSAMTPGTIGALTGGIIGALTSGIIIGALTGTLIGGIAGAIIGGIIGAIGGGIIGKNYYW